MISIRSRGCPSMCAGIHCIAFCSQCDWEDASEPENTRLARASESNCFIVACCSGLVRLALFLVEAWSKPGLCTLHQNAFRILESATFAWCEFVRGPWTSNLALNGCVHTTYTPRLGSCALISILGWKALDGTVSASSGKP